MLSHTLKLSNTFKNAANITAYHTHAFIEKHCNWCDASWCHQPPWPPSSNCPCHPQCGRTATKMTWRMPDMVLSSITTAYHFLVEDNSNWSDTSSSQRPRWSSPPCCPCRPQCCRPPTHMYLTLSDMLPVKKNCDNRNHYSISHPSWKKIPTKVIWFQRLRWSSPPRCLCHPQCRQPPTRMRKSRHVGYPRKEL